LVFENLPFCSVILESFPFRILLKPNLMIL
jgi:hypothetical protein